MQVALKLMKKRLWNASLGWAECSVEYRVRSAAFRLKLLKAPTWFFSTVRFGEESDGRSAFVSNHAGRYPGGHLWQCSITQISLAF